VIAAAAARAARAKPHARRSRPAPDGTTIRLTLSERSLLAIEVSRRGRRGTTVVGTLVRSSVGPGAASVAFSGRIGATVLTPVAYSMSATAIDGAGNRSRPRSTRFTIVRG
jgi:hypothetical protein